MPLPGMAAPLFRSHFLGRIRHRIDGRNLLDGTRRIQMTNHGMKTIIYPVKDIAQAKKLFGTLIGSAPAVDGPYYVGFKVGGQDIGLLPNGAAQGMFAPLGYFHVDDIKKTLEELVKEGAQISQPVRDVGTGRLVAWVKDADGNAIGLIQSA
jgi:predicted enzyme related to lactoylglutathione lyase